jgi:hypothetical protein
MGAVSRASGKLPPPPEPAAPKNAVSVPQLPVWRSTMSERSSSWTGAHCATVARTASAMAWQDSPACSSITAKKRSSPNCVSFSSMGFLDWIARVQELPADKIYHIRFLSTQGILWQRRSLHALHCFAPDLIHVEE